MTKSEQIDAYLLKHFPCMAVPWSEGVKIAALFGVSKQLVNRRAHRFGMPVINKGPIVCADCGKALPGRRVGERRCRECFSKSRRLDLVCDVCGKAFTRLLSHQLVATSDRRATQDVICSRECRSKSQGPKIRAARAVTHWGHKGYVARPPEPCPQCGGVKSKLAALCRKCWAEKRAAAARGERYEGLRS